MENKKGRISRREFMKMVAVFTGAAVANSCGLNSTPVSTENVQEPTPQGSPAETISPGKTSESQTATSSPTLPPEIGSGALTIEQKFIIGNFDTATTPFELKLSDDLNSLMTYIPAANRVLTGDIPLPIKTNWFGTPEQYEIFDKAADDSSLGNPYFVILTDQPNHLFLYFHSIDRDSAGEAMRKISSFVMRNPEKLNDVLGEHITITPKDSQPIEAEIVSINLLDRDYFKNLGEGSPWGVYPDKDNILFAQTEKFGIPDEIIRDQTPGTYYLTIATCQSENGKVSLELVDNIQKRALVTLKFQLP